MKKFAFLIPLLLITSSVLTAQGFLCAVGGGTENYNDWSDAPYSWIVEKSGYGKITVLSYGNATSWIPDYFKSFGASQAVNLKIDSRSKADLQSTYDQIISSDAVFIKGGDQWQYISLWKGTKTEQAITDLFNNGGVIAGTSAGAMVLGQFDFSARYVSLTSKQALLNPLSSNVDIENNFLKLMPGVLFDTHFIERGRFGRLLAMLYKLNVTFGENPLCIGIDDKTALCIDNNGIAEVMGSGAAAFYFTDDGSRVLNSSGTYLMENLACHQLVAGWKFDITNRMIHSIPETAKEVDFVRDSEHPGFNLALTGSNALSGLTENLEQFLNGSGGAQIAVVTHQTFLPSLNQLINYLSGVGFNFSISVLAASTVNDPQIVGNIQNANCYIIAGDSLDALMLLNQGNGSSAAFLNGLADKRILFLGDAGKTAGRYFISGTDSDAAAAYRGRLKNQPGLNLFGDLIFQPRVFEDSDFFENRSSSVLWGLMLNGRRYGIYLDGNDNLVFDPEEKSICGSGNIPFIIYDATDATRADSSVYRGSASYGTRQSAAMNNIRISVSNSPDHKYSFLTRSFVIASGAGSSEEINPATYSTGIYPNPSNGRINFEFVQPQSGYVGITIFDLLGREILKADSGYFAAGKNSVSIETDDLASGIYFCRFSFYRIQSDPGYITFNKFVIIK